MRQTEATHRTISLKLGKGKVAVRSYNLAAANSQLASLFSKESASQSGCERGTRPSHRAFCLHLMKQAMRCFGHADHIASPPPLLLLLLLSPQFSTSLYCSLSLGKISTSRSIVSTTGSNFCKDRSSSSAFSSSPLLILSLHLSLSLSLSLSLAYVEYISLHWL